MCFFADDAGDGDGADGAGGGGAAGEDTGKFDVDLNLDNTGGAGDGGADSIFEIPETYKEKDWAKGIKSADDLWKMTDNSQSLIGKKTLGVPTEASTPEEIAAFNTAFGVPETADAYEIKEDENLIRLSGGSTELSNEVTKEFKTLLHKAGASTKQAEILREGYSGIIGKIMEKTNAEQVAQNTNFDEIAVKTFGDKKDETLDLARGLIKEHAPEGFDDYLATLPNESLIVMAGVLKSIQEKYIDEDDLPRGNSTTGLSEGALRAKIQEIISSKDFQNPLSPNNDTAKKEWMRLSAQLDSIRQKK